VNKKRVERIWRKEGLSLSRRKVKKRKYGSTLELVRKSERKDYVWSYDFLEDRT